MDEVGEAINRQRELERAYRVVLANEKKRVNWHFPTKKSRTRFEDALKLLENRVKQYQEYGD